VNNCRRRIDERSSGSLSCQDVADTETEIINEAKQEAFPEEFKALAKHRITPSSSEPLSLNPVIDGDGYFNQMGNCTMPTICRMMQGTQSFCRGTNCEVLSSEKQPFSGNKPHSIIAVSAVLDHERNRGYSWVEK